MPGHKRPDNIVLVQTQQHHQLIFIDVSHCMCSGCQKQRGAVSVRQNPRMKAECVLTVCLCWMTVNLHVCTYAYVLSVHGGVWIYVFTVNMFPLKYGVVIISQGCKCTDLLVI